MKKALLSLSLLLMSSIAIAQDPCDGMIYDEAHLISKPQTIQEAARKLVDEGADVKVVTVLRMASYGVNLQGVETALESRCASWRSPAGFRKANLIVFMVAPNDRKKNIFYGDDYLQAFPNSDAVDAFYSRASNAFFRSKQWDEGFAAALKQSGEIVASVHDQRTHPASTTINEQPTDLSGLWQFLMWSLIILALGGGGYAIYRLLTARKRNEEQVKEAQMDATNSMIEASNAYTATKPSHPRYQEISERFVRMSNAAKMTPDDGMTIAEYRTIARAWRNLRDDISMRDVEQKPAQPSAPVQPHHRHTTVVNNYSTTPAPGSSGDLLTGVLIGEGIGAASRYREPDPVRYREPEPEPEPERSSSGSDSGWNSGSSSSSGSDSTWSSSDSGNSGGSGSDSGF